MSERLPLSHKVAICTNRIGTKTVLRCGLEGEKLSRYDDCQNITLYGCSGK